MCTVRCLRGYGARGWENEIFEDRCCHGCVAVVDAPSGSYVESAKIDCGLLDVLKL